MAAILPLGLPWNFPLVGDDRSIYAPPRYRLQRDPPRVGTPRPYVPPLSLDEVVLHLRLDPDAVNGPEAPLLEGMVAAAARHLEDYAGITLSPTEWRMTMRHFPPVWNQPLDLPMPPFLELLQIVFAGSPVNVNDYAVEVDESYPARLYHKSGFWPRAWTPTPVLVAIDWRAGYETPDDIPRTLKQAMLMAIGTWYENRESSQQWQIYPLVELGWERLIGHHRAAGFA